MDSGAADEAVTAVVAVDVDDASSDDSVDVGGAVVVVSAATDGAGGATGVPASPWGGPGEDDGAMALAVATVVVAKAGGILGGMVPGAGTNALD